MTRVAWSAPLFDPSGYADEARTFVLGLDQLGVPIRVEPTPWGNRLAELEAEERRRLDRLQRVAPPAGDPYVRVQHTFPPFFARDPRAAATVGRTMFETDRIPDAWVAQCNLLDEVWVPTDFNLETFARAGVAPAKLRKVPGGIDARRFTRPCAPYPVPGARGFMFLSVFDWSLRKGWDVLLRAFLEEFGMDEDVTLVLKTYSSYGHTPQQILDRVHGYVRTSLGLDPRQTARIVLLGEVLSSADLLRLYQAADAYVAPSRGEGWGRPQMEAMASGLPTIATGWSGTTEFMTTENSYPLESSLVPVPDAALSEVPTYRGHRWAEPSVAHLRWLLRHVFTHQAEARARGARARAEVLERYDRARVASLAADHLQRLLRAPLAAPSVIWEGSQLVHHSLAKVNREVCLQLLDSGRVDLSLIPFERHEFGASVDPRFPGLMDRVRRPSTHPPAVHVRHQWPPSFIPPAEGAWVMIQPWEFGSIPASWVEPMRDHVDEIWVPSTWVRDCYVKSGIPGEKVQVIPNGVDLATYRPEGPAYPLKTRKRFKFLFLGGTIVRKGIDILLDAFASNFTADDDVCLVVKASGTGTVYRNSPMAAFFEEAARLPNGPEFEYVPDKLSDVEIAALYRACNALVHPYRGEGFAMPVAEAMACGLPVLVTDSGACMDFCDRETAFLIPSHQTPLPTNHQLSPPSAGYWWAEPDRLALAGLMRYVVEHPDAARQIAERGRARIQAFTWQHAGALAGARIRELATRVPRRFLHPSPFRPGVPPLPLDGRRGTTFLHQPHWGRGDWKAVVQSYARAWAHTDDVTLVLWLDPAQGVSEAAAGERIDAALREISIDPGACADLLLVPDALDLNGLASLYAAVEWVVPLNDPVQAACARLSGVRVLEDVSRAGWHAAAGAVTGGRSARQPALV